MIDLRRHGYFTKRRWGLTARDGLTLLRINGEEQPVSLASGTFSLLEHRDSTPANYGATYELRLIDPALPSALRRVIGVRVARERFRLLRAERLRMRPDWWSLWLTPVEASFTGVMAIYKRVASAAGSYDPATADATVDDPEIDTTFTVSGYWMSRDEQKKIDVDMALAVFIIPNTLNFTPITGDELEIQAASTGVQATSTIVYRLVKAQATFEGSSMLRLILERG